MWERTKTWLYEKRDVFFWGAIFAAVWYFALWSTASRTFVESMANAFAWPIVLLILVGHRYRRPLAELIDRVLQIEAFGLSMKANSKAYDNDQAKELREKMESETEPAEKERLRKLLDLSVESLRLLGTLAAVGTRQRLNLTLYTNSRRRSAAAFRQAIEQLLEESLITDRGQHYQPTHEGIAVLKLHLDSIEKEID